MSDLFTLLQGRHEHLMLFLLAEGFGCVDITLRPGFGRAHEPSTTSDQFLNNIIIFM